MNLFEASNRSEAIVAASQKEIWAALTDPVLLAQFTPHLSSIDVDGDTWRWNLSRIPVLSTTIAPSFTVVMSFDEPTRIDFSPAPDSGTERAAATGTYILEHVDGGTHLLVDLKIGVRLPLPRAARHPVTATMTLVMAFMGKRFSANLLRHLSRD